MTLDDQYFKNWAKQETAEYKKRLKEILYWKDVANMFREHQKKGTTEMIASFPHDGNKDNEDKIIAYAKVFGYKPQEHEICSNQTIFTFVKI